MPIESPCCSANFSNSGRRAIEPSSFMISQITAAGSRPARRARSQPASVWPARIKTPPGRACTGKICPGCTKSLGFAFAATAVCTVRDRSAALIPVVTPSAASILTVKAVLWRSVLSITMGGNPNWRQRASVSVRQISPRAYLAIKLMCSGVQ